MRICITRSERYSYSETFIRDQIAGFSEMAEVFPIHSGRLPERKEDGSILNSWLFWVLHKVLRGITGRRNNYFGNYGLKKYLAANKVDVVLANYGISAAHLVPVCRELDIPLLVIFHGHDATDRKLLKQYAKKYQDLFQYASAIITVSQDMSRRIKSMGAEPGKISVVPCGVDAGKFRPTAVQKKDQFLAVGRFVPKKGPLYTIRAFHQAWLTHPQARLVMVGKKNRMFEQCDELVKELGLQNAVVFPGVLQREQIIELMNCSLCFVQHSITAPNGDMEGTPVSVLEASAAGLPVVSTLHGGIKDAVLHHETGFLVEEGDVEAMASYMTSLLEDHGLAARLGAAGQRHIVANYSQPRQITKLYQLAQEAIQKKRLAQMFIS